MQLRLLDSEHLDSFIISGNKPKWLPYEIELPKHRRRPVAGRPRTGSQERSRATPENTRDGRDGARDTREGMRRREGRGGGGVGGRESSERAAPGSARRTRREPGDKAAEPSSSEDHEPVDGSNKPNGAETSHSDRGIYILLDYSVICCSMYVGSRQHHRGKP